MGQRYEKNRKSVSENKQTLERLHTDKDTLHKEYAPLSLLESIQGLLDDEAAEAIHGVKSVGEFESQRIESETDTAEEEKKQITSEINSEIAKLNAGLDKLRKSGNIEFGKKAVEQSSQEYKKQIDKFRALLGELEADHKEGTKNSSNMESVSSFGQIETNGNTEYSEQKNTDQLENSQTNNSFFGNNSFLPLLFTNQEITNTTLDGKSVTVFDHPFDDSPGRVCQQGSAFPNDGNGNGITGTCGCCACGTIINKAGGNATEKSVVKYALQNDLCSNRRDAAPESRGGTSPDDWVGILAGAGISAKEKSDSSLEQLAEYVEHGHGVVVGLSACTISPEWYGHYMPGVHDGHAVVIESIVRDPESNKILEYIISDSNGSSTYDACRRIPAKRFEKACRRRRIQGRLQAVVTDEVIW